MNAYEDADAAAKREARVVALARDLFVKQGPLGYDAVCVPNLARFAFVVAEAFIAACEARNK